jgi:hypothetical protein
MSTDNAARFYWGKLDKAFAIFEAGNLEESADLSLQLINEFRCPRSVHSIFLVVSAGSRDLVRQYLIRLPDTDFQACVCLSAVIMGKARANP